MDGKNEIAGRPKITTDARLIEELKKNGFGTYPIIVDDEGGEYIPDYVDATMGGQFHLVLHLKKVKDEKNKWFKTKAAILEKLRSDLAAYEKQRPEFEKTFGKKKFEEMLEDVRDDIESVEKNMKEGERSDAYY